MRNYSFVLTSSSGPEQLYRMGEFPDSDHAFCLAELIASDLSLDENRQWSGWTIEVRDGEGLLVFCVPVSAGYGDSLRPANSAVGISAASVAA